MHGAALGNSRTAWQVKFPRKQRARQPAKPQQTAPPPAVLPRQAPPRNVLAASSPAALAFADTTSRQGQVKESARSLLAKRLACGRSPDNLALLVDCNPFLAHADSLPRVRAETCPCRGLTATLDAAPVLILDAFLCRQRRQCDVALVQPVASRPGLFTLGRLRTVPASDLRDVRLDFVVLRATSSAVHLQRRQPDAPLTAAIVLNYSLRAPSGQAAQATQPCCAVQPGLSLQHAEKYSHVVEPRPDRCHTLYLLDLPVPIPFLAQAYQCRTCKDAGSSCEAASYFTVQDADVLRVFPDALVARPPKQRACFFTRRFLLHLLLSFYASLNAREVRRGLMQLMSSNCLSWQLWHARQEASPFGFLHAIAAIPPGDTLRYIIANAFSSFLDRQAGKQRHTDTHTHTHTRTRTLECP